MKTMIYTLPQTRADIGFSSRSDRVTLPAPPFPINLGNLKDAAPVSLPIRSTDDWRKFDKMLRKVEKGWQR